MDHSSSEEDDIKSQADIIDDMSYDNDPENERPGSISQAQFATQIPLSESAKKHKSNLLHVTRDTKPVPAVKLKKKKDADLLDQLKYDSPTTVKLQNHDDLASTIADLTQQQIVVPPSSVAVDNPEDNNLKQAEIGPIVEDEGNQPVTSSMFESMPDVVFQQLRGWRKECHDGRYIPRRLQMIPKDQARLLESDDRWQPPLVGHAHRPGSVPLGILNILTEEADSRQPEADLHTKSLPTVAVVSSGESIEHPVSISQDRNGSRSPSEAGTEESEEVDWSSSPPQPLHAQRELPPDSPITSGGHQSLIDELEQPKPTKQVDSAEAPRIDVDGRQNGIISEHFKNDEGVSRKPAVEHIKPQKQPSTTNPSKPMGADNLPLPSTLLASSKSAVPDFQKTVHVKRTPFCPKEFLDLQDVPESSATVIPGTFDERAIPQKEGLRENTYADDPGLGKGPEKEDSHFEVDSSEDEAESNRWVDDGRASKSALGDQARISKEQAHLDLQAADSGNQQTLAGRPHNKRSREDNHLEMYKRVKLNKTKAGAKIVNDSDYNTIDQDRARYRRQYLSNISKGQGSAEPVVSSAETALNEMATVSSRISAIRSNTLRSSPGAERDDRKQGHLPSEPRLQRYASNQAKGTSESNSTTSEQSNQLPVRLYTNFVATYPSYIGHQTHFDAACRLLTTLHSQGKATHPSLWDDFVFRHLHDYRAHLQEVMERSGNALPYERFYEECIEQPTCLQRIIKLAHIDTLKAALVSTKVGVSSIVTGYQPSVPRELKTNDLVAPDRSIAADSSVSNVVNNKAIATSELHPKSHTEPRNIPSQPLSTAKEIDETIPHNESQDSQTSVKMWLERAAGAESPILGTPEADNITKLTDIPSMKLTNESVGIGIGDSSPVPERLKKSRSLPWSSATALNTPSRSANAMIGGNTVHSASTIKSTNKMAPSIPVKQWLSSSQRNTFKKPGRPLLGDLIPKPSTAPGDETAFQRYVRLCKDLPGERRAFEDMDTRSTSLVDIFTWRK